MVEAWPSAPLVVPETDFLLELQVVALDPPTHFARSTRARNEIFLLTLASQYFVGSGSPLDHSISSVSSGRDSVRLDSETYSAIGTIRRITLTLIRPTLGRLVTRSRALVHGIEAGEPGAALDLAGDPSLHPLVLRPFLGN